MPLIHLHYPKGTFTPDALTATATQFTRDGEGLEKIPLSEWAMSTTFIYAHEHAPELVLHGGKPGGNRVVSVEINVIQGGYSATTKTELIKRVTDTIGKYGDLPKEGPRRVYVVIREVAEANWGFDGQNINLEVLRDPASAEGQEPL
ncbi:hypothetical protein LTR97_005181 [Elasticomyces elasticus]|uniref:4-oxalocrotonate tautomerase-like domain-containing protein n=1 Tax=Elasticomyces elasticus TaxID=574655 RepID=A0AAN7ZNR9_9PEZI|nr:hypothetical protein LTR97_005181 [Elasticomyces elasticus]